MEWISVEDRLPEMGVVVLVSGCSHEHVIAYKTCMNWYRELDDTVVINSTHWMPLPEPPNKQGG